MEDEKAEGEETEIGDVMSEVHIGKPPIYDHNCISQFSFSSTSLELLLLSDEMLEVSEKDDGDNSVLTSDNSVVHSRAEYSGKFLSVGEGTSSESLAVDEDGDLVLDRRKNGYERGWTYELCIQHYMCTPLRNVGLQVWKAALLLADFVLYKSFTSSDFNGITAIELGAGTGLVGIALAQIAGTVFITDKGTEVLENCKANADFNSRSHKHHYDEVYVRELDWKESWPPPVGKLDGSDSRSRFSWSNKEIEEAEKATVLLAADIIYSNNLTDLFFSTVHKLMSRGSNKVLYLTLEKRYNFSMNDLDVVANGYAHFRSFLKDKECAGTDGTSALCFMGERIDLDEVPQYIREYERGEDLEMWKISYRRN